MDPDDLPQFSSTVMGLMGAARQDPKTGGQAPHWHKGSGSYREGNKGLGRYLQAGVSPSRDIGANLNRRERKTQTPMGESGR